MNYWVVLFSTTRNQERIIYLAQRPNKGLYGGMVEPLLYDKSEETFETWKHCQNHPMWMEFESDFGQADEELNIFFVTGRIDITMVANSDIEDISILATWDGFDMVLVLFWRKRGF